jgi:c-di-GMP-binding flagellar brake protein YcgR
MHAEKRGHTRAKVRAPIELTPQGNETPLRTETADLSVGGCYIEMLFTLPVATEMQISLEAGGSTILTAGKVVTRDPNVGNGIEFTSMTHRDRETLRKFIEDSQQKKDIPPQNQS